MLNFLNCIYTIKCKYTIVFIYRAIARTVSNIYRIFFLIIAILWCFDPMKLSIKSLWHRQLLSFRSDARMLQVANIVRTYIWTERYDAIRLSHIQSASKRIEIGRTRTRTGLMHFRTPRQYPPFLDSGCPLMMVRKCARSLIKGAASDNRPW